MHAARADLARLAPSRTPQSALADNYYKRCPLLRMPACPSLAPNRTLSCHLSACSSLSWSSVGTLLRRSIVCWVCVCAYYYLSVCASTCNYPHPGVQPSRPHSQSSNIWETHVRIFFFKKKKLFARESFKTATCWMVEKALRNLNFFCVCVRKRKSFFSPPSDGRHFPIYILFFVNLLPDEICLIPWKGRTCCPTKPKGKKSLLFLGRRKKNLWDKP